MYKRNCSNAPAAATLKSNSAPAKVRILAPSTQESEQTYFEDSQYESPALLRQEDLSWKAPTFKNSQRSVFNNITQTATAGLLSLKSTTSQLHPSQRVVLDSPVPNRAKALCSIRAPIMMCESSDDETQLNLNVQKPDDTIRVFRHEQQCFLSPPQDERMYADENMPPNTQTTRKDDSVGAKRKQASNPWAEDAMRWTSAADLLLLREVSNLTVQSLHQHDHKLAWSQIFVTLHEGRKDIFDNMKSGEACKKRFEKLRSWHKTNNKNLKKSGSVTEYNEKVQLLDDIQSFHDSAVSKSMPKSKTQQDLLQKGKVLRDAAMGDWKPTENKSKRESSPTSAMANALMLLIQQKMGNPVNSPFTKDVPMADVPDVQSCLAAAHIPVQFFTLYSSKLEEGGYDSTFMLKLGTSEQFTALGLKGAHAQALALFMKCVVV